MAPEPGTSCVAFLWALADGKKLASIETVPSDARGTGVAAETSSEIRLSQPSVRHYQEENPRWRSRLSRKAVTWHIWTRERST